MKRKTREMIVTALRLTKMHAEHAEDVARVMSTNEDGAKPNDAQIRALTEIRSRALNAIDGLTKIADSIEMYIGAHALLEQIGEAKGEADKRERDPNFS